MSGNGKYPPHDPKSKRDCQRPELWPTSWCKFAPKQIEQTLTKLFLAVLILAEAIIIMIILWRCK